MKEPSLPESLLHWWWKVTAPESKELIYRGRVTSSVMIVIIIDLILGLVSRYNTHLYIVISAVFFVDLFALVAFNRRGKIFLAGLIITIVSEAGLLVAISQQIISVGQIDFSNYIVLPLLIQPIILAASLLSESAGIILFLINLLYVIGMLAIFPKDPVVLHHISFEGFQDLIVQPAIIYIAGLLIPLIFVKIYTQALGAAHLAVERSSLDQEYMKLLKGEASHLREAQREVIAALAGIINQPRSPLQFSSSNDEMVAFLNILQKHLLQASETEEAVIQLLRYVQEPQSQWTPTGTSVDAVVWSLQHAKHHERGG